MKTEEATTSRGDVFWKVIGSGLGFGYAPIISGTFGTIPAVALVWAIQGLNNTHYWYWYLLIVTGLAAIGIPAGTRLEQVYRQKDTGVIVIDEIVGYCLSMFLLPGRDWRWILAGFLLFRIMDVVKLPPGRRLERLPAGVGVMMDDVVAGVYTNLILLVCRWYSGG